MPHRGHELFLTCGISLTTGQQGDNGDAGGWALSRRVFEEAEVGQLEDPAVFPSEDEMMAGEDVKPCPEAL